mmetsp:Transcript_984/g.4174  ORF Transcript_984/g.4174 Transcript_984/m.4174 type:complete len:284 (-) Transcript_984:203-1054(-)
MGQPRPVARRRFFYNLRRRRSRKSPTIALLSVARRADARRVDRGFADGRWVRRRAGRTGAAFFWRSVFRKRDASFGRRVERFARTKNDSRAFLPDSRGRVHGTSRLVRGSDGGFGTRDRTRKPHDALRDDVAEKVRGSGSGSRPGAARRKKGASSADGGQKTKERGAGSSRGAHPSRHRHALTQKTRREDTTCHISISSVYKNPHGSASRLPRVKSSASDSSSDSNKPFVVAGAGAARFSNRASSSSSSSSSNRPPLAGGATPGSRSAASVIATKSTVFRPGR